MAKLLLIAEIQTRILNWYAENRRDLPWRGRTDPYEILVSEIMLQQTGVERVAETYQRFLDQFPTFASLAAAPRGDVLRAWAGLGYNRRAVYLHECAKLVVRDYDGQLPSAPEKLRRLPGIGPYTVAAIQSFAFGAEAAALDTNIRRVIGRVAFDEPPSDLDLNEVAGRLLPAGRSAEWNQALMDFGSLQCTARRPACVVCPLLDLCAAVQQFSPRAFERKVAERPEPYLGSRRYYRGKIVAFVRELPPGQTASLDAVLAAVKLTDDGHDRTWIESLVRDLEAEGLVKLAGGDELRIAVPT